MYRHFIRTIVRAYPDWVTKTYVYIRFKIINPSILEIILNYFQPEKKLLIMGCGFGLFDICLGMRWPAKQVCGMDIDTKRIELAKRAAKTIGLRNNVFICQDITKLTPSPETFQEILLLDVAHHIPIDAQERLFRACFTLLAPEGYLVIKDIHCDNRPKLFFTWVLDMLMTKGQPVFYRDKDELQGVLEDIGFSVMPIYLDDILPYPHILYVCSKRPSTQQ